MKIKKYIECYIPTETCNLKCHYCYITQQRKFNNKIVEFQHTPEEIRKALSIQRLGGTCLLNLCAGGETLLGQGVIPVLRELLEEGHYIMVVTNGLLSNRLNEIIEFPNELLKRLIFKFSFHYLELVRLNKIDSFFDNISKIQKAGCSFTLEITPNDELIPYIEEIKKLCIEKLGTLCHITIARDDRTRRIEVLSKYSLEEFVGIWDSFKSELLDFKKTIFYKKRKEFCYAGDWSYYLNLVTGSVRQCYCGREIDNIYEDIDRPLKAEAIGKNCTLPHCYNGHSFLTLGTIPELETPTYAQVRDRVNELGEHWLQPEVRSFIGQKLKDNNELYSESKKRILNNKGKIFTVIKLPRRIAGTLKKKIKRGKNI